MTAVISDDMVLRQIPSRPVLSIIARAKRAVSFDVVAKTEIALTVKLKTEIGLKTMWPVS